MFVSENLETRMEEILEQLRSSETDEETRELLIKEFKTLNDVSVDIFKADSDDTNNNNRNRVEKIKSRNDLIGKLASAIISAGVACFVAARATNFEELGVITSKAWGLIPKFKF